MQTKPAKQLSNLGADAIESPARSHTGPTASSTAGGDWTPNHLLSEQRKLEQETTNDRTPSHASPAVSSAEHLRPENLWDEAYKLLQKKDAKLIDAYEKDLLASQDPDQQGASVQIGFSLAERHQVPLSTDGTYAEMEHACTVQMHQTIEHSQAEMIYHQLTVLEAATEKRSSKSWLIASSKIYKMLN